MTRDGNAGERPDGSQAERHGAAESPACRIAPPAFLSEPALADLLALLPEARIVGGAVRDTLAGRPLSDVDMASPLPPATVLARLVAAGVKVVPTGLAHGTVTAVLAGRPVEITTLRRDIETDGRHAVVAFTDDWREDAARRDFTINAMSMTRDGAVFDYFEGMSDLQSGRLRFVGDPAARVAEDYLRVLRFFRFYARYGRVEPDEATLAALRGAVPRLASLSVERVWNELVRILSAPDPLPSMTLMDRLGVLAAVVPQGTDVSALARLAGRGAPPDPLLRLAALLSGDILAFSARMKVSLADRDRMVALRTAPLAKPDDNDTALRRLLADTSAETLSDRTFLVGGGGEAWDLLRTRLRSMPKPLFPLEGRDLVSLGMPPGPRIGALLRTVRSWWLAGGCVADSDACRAEARRLIEG
jgi:poly(A) polymerase/tRNA nucleotidyltransferase (CCA-adding enzyme)